MMHVPLPVLGPEPEKSPTWSHQAAMDLGADCRSCAAWGCGRGPVLDETPPPGRARLTILAEAPGNNEVELGAPLVGASGRELMRSLTDGGFVAMRPSEGGTDIALGNTVLCQPPGGLSFREWHERLEHARKLRELGKPEVWPEGTAPNPGWTKTPLEACRGRLTRYLAEHSPDGGTILTLGAEALRAVAAHEGLPVTASPLKPKDVTPGDAEEEDAPSPASPAYDPGESVATSVCGLASQHGAPVTLSRGRVWIATYHPAFAMRKKPWTGVVKDEIARAARIALRPPGAIAGSKVGWGRVDWVEPEAFLFRSADEFLGWMGEVPQGAHLVCDIETGPSEPGADDASNVLVNHLRCVGLGWSPGSLDLMANVPGTERVAVVPVRHMDAVPWYDAADTERLRRAMSDLFDRTHLIGQNFNFDLRVLVRDGYITEDRAAAGCDNTLLLHRNSYESDLRHNLSFMGRRALEVPVWKGVPHKSWDRVWDRVLHAYATKDILVTLRIIRWLRESVGMAGNTASYWTDYELETCLREMSSMGLFIDEDIRGLFTRKASVECAKLAKKWVDLVGKPVNPSSPEQVGTLLYEDWGLVPMVATDGYEWDEGKPAATSRAALVALMRRDLKPEQHEALSTLLTFRGYSKLKGTYLEGFKVYPVEDSSLLSEIRSAPAVEGWRWTPDGRGESYEALPARPGLSKVYTTFRGEVTPSGRLSSVEPNFQNIPSRGLLPVKEMFRAPPGHVFVGADYEQLEARLYAIEAEDRILLETIRNGLDIHSMNAASLFAAKPDDRMDWYKRIEEQSSSSERKAFRGVAKEFVFSLIYTAEALKIYATMASKRDVVTGRLVFPDITPEQCEAWYAGWHRDHPETKAWHKAIEREVREFGESRIKLGDFRARSFPWGPEKFAMAVNHRIQSTAAWLANRAMLRIRKGMGYRRWSPHSGLVLQVHDDIQTVAPESRAQEAADIVGRAMEDNIKGVPLPAPRDIQPYLIPPKMASALRA